MTCASQTVISALSAEEAADCVHELGALLHACVLDGASIGFVLPFSTMDAEGFWITKVLPRLQSRTLVLLVARQNGQISGSAQLDCDTPPNQLHRAEVRKLLVHPDFRRRGIGKALMAILEHHASQLGRSLLTLDTRTGDAAEPLYASLGYRTSGVIPDYCRDVFEDRLDSTTVMYKLL